ncbi:MAG: AAA family ATPase [bacterium]|nr:AAA family ATPase [bacterium]
MYEEYWGLKEKPFENTPNPKYFYRSHQHEEAYTRLLYVIREQKGAAFLSGIYGCGKTTVGRALMKELESDVYKVAYITNPRLDDVELLRMITYKLGREPRLRKADVLIDLEKTIIENINDGKKVVVVIDEAHTIEDLNIFEELRLLLNLQTDEAFMLTLLLLGQPELKSKIENIKQFHQRIALMYNLTALTKEDTKNYISHRISVAGGVNAFTEDAIQEIYKKSGGIPRRINQICDLALLVGANMALKSIDSSVIKELSEVTP